MQQIRNPAAKKRARERRDAADAYVEPDRFSPDWTPPRRHKGGNDGTGSDGAGGQEDESKPKRMRKEAKVLPMSSAPDDVDALSVLAMASSLLDLCRRYSLQVRDTESRSMRNPDGSTARVSHVSLNSLGGMINVRFALQDTFTRAVSEDTIRGINYCLSEQRTRIFALFFDVDAILDVAAAMGMGIKPEIDDAMVLAIARIVQKTVQDFYIHPDGVTKRRKTPRNAAIFACIVLVGAVKIRRDGRVKRGIHLHFPHCNVNTLNAKWICMEAGRRVAVAFPCLDRREVSDMSVYESNGIRMPFQMKPKACPQCKAIKGNDSGLTKRPEQCPPTWSTLEAFERPQDEAVEAVSALDRKFTEDKAKSATTDVIRDMSARVRKDPSVFDGNDDVESGLNEAAIVKAQRKKKGLPEIDPDLAEFGLVKSVTDRPWDKHLKKATDSLHACSVFPPQQPVILAPRHFRADEFYKRGSRMPKRSTLPARQVVRQSVCGNPLCFGCRVVEPEDMYTPLFALQYGGLLSNAAMKLFRDMYKVLRMCQIRTRDGTEMTPYFKIPEGCEPPPSSFFLSYPPPRDYAGDALTSVPGVYQDNVTWEAIARTSKNRQWRTMPEVTSHTKKAAILALVHHYKVRPDWFSPTTDTDERIERYKECTVEEIRYNEKTKQYAVWIQGRFCNFCENQKGNFHECDSVTYFIVDKDTIKAQCTCSGQWNLEKRKHGTCAKFNKNVEIKFEDRRLTLMDKRVLFGEMYETRSREETIASLVPTELTRQTSLVGDVAASVASSSRSSGTGVKSSGTGVKSSGTGVKSNGTGVRSRVPTVLTQQSNPTTHTQRSTSGSSGDRAAKLEDVLSAYKTQRGGESSKKKKKKDKKKKKKHKKKGSTPSVEEA